MRIPSVVSALLSAASILAAGSALASPADVTFQLPVNLTRIHVGVTSVKVACTIHSNGLRPLPNVYGRIAEVVIPVTQGSVVQTVQVVVPLTDVDFSNNASGQQATYKCELLSNYGGLWRPFDGQAVGNKMTPALAAITGAFVW